jgi:hypothetical protein
MTSSRILLALLLLEGTAALAQEEPTVTLHSTVTGSKEQPRVMYLVPWQQPGEARFEYSMQHNFADELFVPIDRDEFVRGLEYQVLLDPVTESTAAGQDE